MRVLYALCGGVRLLRCGVERLEALIQFAATEVAPSVKTHQFSTVVRNLLGHSAGPWARASIVHTRLIAAHLMPLQAWPGSLSGNSSVNSP